MPPDCSEDLNVTPCDYQSGQEDKSNTGEYSVYLAAHHSSIQVYADGFTWMKHKQVCMLPERYACQNPEGEQTRQDDHHCSVSGGEDLFV